jgi:hypothetical protein
MRPADDYAKGALAVVAVLSLAAAPAPTNDREATVVQELVVTARDRGPAWWRVSTPTSTVYVLGVPTSLPKGIKWDTVVLERHLTGANQLIGATRVTAGVGDFIPLWSASRRFRSKTPMENGLSPDLRQRFEAVRARLSHDPHAYSGWTPAAASLFLVGDFRKQTGQTEREPLQTISRLGARHGLKMKPIDSYRLLALVRTGENQVVAAGPACLDDALSEVEAGAEPVRIAAEGWTRGDVAAALKGERGYEKCLSRFPEGQSLVNNAMTDGVTAISNALNQPGHSVAIINLRTLLAKGGVLQQLQARGYKVSNPNQ